MHTYELCQCRSIPEVYAKQWRILWWFSVRSSLSSINEDLCASDLQGSAGKWYQKGNKKTWKPYVIWAIMHMDIGLTIYKLWRCLNLLIITPDIILNNKKSLYVRLYFYTGAGDRTWTCTVTHWFLRPARLPFRHARALVFLLYHMKIPLSMQKIMCFSDFLVIKNKFDFLF